MSERSFQAYENLSASDRSVENLGRDVFEDVYNVSTDPREIVRIVENLHDQVVIQSCDSIQEVIYCEEILNENHLKEINRLKKEMRTSEDIFAYITSNLDFLISAQASDGDMIDFIRNAL